MSIIEIITLIIAIITCFFGYKLNKGLIAVLGLIIGFNLGITYLPNLIENETAVYIASIILAIALGLISFKLYLVGVFLLCALFAYIFCENLNLSENIQMIVSLIAGLIAGIIGVKFTRPLMIISTSLAGAGIISETALNLLNIKNDTISIIIILILAILGMIYQFKQNDENSHS